MLIGIDTGGTFTDFLVLDQGQIKVLKLPSQPDAPEQAILSGIRTLLPAGDDHHPFAEITRLVHGTTIATNAALERKEAKTLFITNRGFKNLLSIGRQTRPELFELKPQNLEPPVPKQLCLEVGGRLSADAELIDPLKPEDFDAIGEAIALHQPDAVAIVFLFAFLDDQYEKAVENYILSQGFERQSKQPLYCSTSAFVLPQYKEYERGISTWLNASLSPLVANYLSQLSHTLNATPLEIMQSSGGTFDAEIAKQRAVNLLLSGPAGGLAAASFIAQSLNESRKLLTFDMGGTSTDVALIDDEIELTDQGKLHQFPVAVPMVDLHTIGAGGGSIAFIDQGGLLQVGPKSAGASPGPACYGLGGTQPTVTDANLILGRIRPDHFLGGKMALNSDAAATSIQPLAQALGLTLIETAAGIIQLAEEHMSRALKKISIERGHDLKDFSLFSFGGAGGLHICALAETLLMKQAIVPIHCGVLSALGMLAAPRQTQLSHSCQRLLRSFNMAQLQLAFDQLVATPHAKPDLHIHQINTPSSILYRLDLAYQGQSSTLSLKIDPAVQSIDDIEAAFHQAHQSRYGHQLNQEIVIINLKAGLCYEKEAIILPELPQRRQVAKKRINVNGREMSLYRREDFGAGFELAGPAIIVEATATTYLQSGWHCCVDRFGNLNLKQLS